MNIQINEKIRIKSDDKNYIIQVYTDKKNDKEDRKSDGWCNYGYYGKISHCLKGLLEMKLKSSDIKTIEELRKDIVNSLSDFTNKIDGMVK